jgi:hypothetical protein
MLAAFHLQLGNLPDWVGAIGTVAVFTVTAFVVIRDQGSRREERDTKSYDAALTVTVVVGPAPTTPTRPPLGATTGAVAAIPNALYESVPRLSVRNDSTRTIYRVVAEMRTGSGISLGSMTWDEIPPGRWKSFDGQEHADMWSTTGPGGLDVLATATFTDAGRARWYRDSGGTIHRV